MEQVNVKDFDKLKGIVEKNIKRCNISDRTSYDYVKATSTLFAAQGNAVIWVDDLKDPHALLIVTAGKFGVLNEKFCFINTVYIDEGHESMDLVKEMITTAEMWGRSQGCSVSQVSSWIYRGCLDTGKLWEKLGYSPQETIHVKGL